MFWLWRIRWHFSCSSFSFLATFWMVILGLSRILYVILVIVSKQAFNVLTEPDSISPHPKWYKILSFWNPNYTWLVMVSKEMTAIASFSLPLSIMWIHRFWNSSMHGLLKEGNTSKHPPSNTFNFYVFIFVHWSACYRSVAHYFWLFWM